MGDKFTVGSRVFAKIKGYPHWPGKITERVPGKEEKYKIYFYGTHDEGQVKADQIVLYSEVSKGKYGKATRKPKFNEGIEELEKDIGEEMEEVAETEAVPEAAVEEVTKVETEEKAAESEGELMIDEGSSSPKLPPVLTREISKTETPETGKKRPRSLSKRDSLTGVSNNATAPILSAPEPPPPEIVSRSGRKIKPKRFADDDISTPTKGGKAASGEDGGPPAKRSKRASKSIGKAAPTPVPAAGIDAPETEEEAPAPAPAPVPESTPAKSKGGQAKGRNSSAAIQKNISRLSPDIVTPPANRGPPELKPASAAARNRSNSTSNKQIPALVSAVKAPARKSGRQTRAKSTEQLVEEAAVEGVKLDDKENSTAEAEDSIAQISDSELPADDGQASMPIKKRAASANKDVKKESTEKKLRFPGKNGLHFELSYNSEKPEAHNEQDKMEWKSIAAKNVQKLKIDLVQNESESQEIINNTAEAIENIDVDEAKLREKRSVQIRLLRLEGEVIEIIGEIVGCLSISAADCDRTIELLNRLASHQLNKLMLKKHPEVVDTIKKLRCYIGNIEEWGLDTDQLDQFEMKALAIRQKAVEIYRNFQDLFCSNPEESFSKIFWKEVEIFNRMVADYPMKTILGLTEVDGQLYKFDSDSNGMLDDEGETNGTYGDSFGENGILNQEQDMYEEVED